jgi:hypothetical protein
MDEYKPWHNCGGPMARYLRYLKWRPSSSNPYRETNHERPPLTTDTFKVGAVVSVTNEALYGSEAMNQTGCVSCDYGDSSYFQDDWGRPYCPEIGPADPPKEEELPAHLMAEYREYLQKKAEFEERMKRYQAKVDAAVAALRKASEEIQDTYGVDALEAWYSEQ